LVTIGGRMPLCKNMHECFAHAASLECAATKLLSAIDRGDNGCMQELVNFFLDEIQRYDNVYDCNNLPGIIKPSLGPNTILVIQNILNVVP
jgi:hypothetical protein